jgi:hypothetical protein
MAKTALYLRFVYPKKTKGRIKLEFAVVTFGDTVLTEAQKKEFEERFSALPSCKKVVRGRNGKNVVVNSTCDTSEEEKNFITEVEACAREYYEVKDVSHDKK